MRLFDWLRAANWPQPYEYMRDLFADATAVDITNVANYYWQDAKTEWHDRNDFPNVAPPWATAFFEYAAPKQAVFAEGPMSVRHTGKSRFGVLTAATEMDSIAPDLLKTRPAARLWREGGARWWVLFSLFAGDVRDGRCYGPLYQWEMGIMPDGRIGDGATVGLAEGSLMANLILPQDSPAARITTGDTWEEKALNADAGMRALIHPVLLALSFCHCKNVEMVEQEPPAAVARKSLKRRGVPMHRYRVLEIEAMRQVLRREGKSDTTGLKNSLHICRGHFRTYTPEKPLLGKAVGTFWVSQHVRGSLATGSVTKDYKVTP